MKVTVNGKDILFISFEPVGDRNEKVDVALSQPVVLVLRNKTFA